MASVSLEGRAVLVVGASAGIGRAFAAAAVRSGARVVLSARRPGKLAEAIEAAGGGHAAVGDACDERDCRRVVAEAVDLVGPLDLLVYAAGWAPLRALADTTPQEWSRALATNVVGANQMIRAAVGHLAPAGVVAVLSSEAATTPRYGLGAYGASKAALEASVRCWRNEHPEARFCNVVVGQTFPTEFGDGFEAEALAAAFEHWGRNGLLQAEFMTPEGVASVLVATFAAALAHPDVGTHDLVLRSPSAAVGPAPASVTADATGSDAADGADGAGRADGGRLPSESPPGTKPPWA